MRRHSLKGENILDFGSGPGFLAKHILELGLDLKYSALDFSKDSIEELNQKYEKSSIFKKSLHIKKLPSVYADEEFDSVISIEVIEHLNEEYLHDSLNEIHRLLRINGTVIITTPNDEDLSINEEFCPNCGCIYHKWQHINSFDQDKLEKIMDEHGFKTEFITQTNFIRDKSLLRNAYFFIRKIFSKNPYHKPHLIYIGKKL